MTLSALLSQRASEFPRKLCIKFEDKKFTYSDIDTMVTDAARGLGKMGLQHGERVAILMSNCPEYIISYFAILRAGGTAVPVNTFLTPSEVAYILRDSACRIFIYNNPFLSHAEKIRKDIPELDTITFEEIPDATELPEASREDDIAAFIYTSGTTGFPKGAMLTHGNLIANVTSCKEVMQLSQRDRILLFLPLFHSFSFTVCVLLPIYSGATIVLLQSVKPFSKIIKSVLQDRITFFVAVPTVYNILSRKKISPLMRHLIRFLISVRACVSGAAALPESTLSTFQKKFNVPLIEGYGLTEASPVVAVNPLKGVRKPSSVGLPIPGVTVQVVGENGESLATGEAGELIARGPNIMQGYYGKPEETEAVLKDGWLYTGDMATIDADGYISIVDRKKDLIIVDGMNIYPREVEDVIMRNHSVEECSMVGIPDGRGSELTVLFVKRKETASVDEKELRALMKGSLARFKIPRRIMFIEEFPKTATGKIKKTELRKWKL